MAEVTLVKDAEQAIHEGDTVAIPGTALRLVCVAKHVLSEGDSPARSGLRVVLEDTAG